MLNNGKIKSNEEAFEWINFLENQITDWIQEIKILSPWTKNNSIPEKFRGLKIFQKIPSLKEVARMNIEFHEELASFHNNDKTNEEQQWLYNLELSINEASTLAKERISIIHDLAAQCSDFSNMEYNFL